MPNVPGENGIDALIRFARLASEAGAGASILPLLSDTLVRSVGADAVAVLEIRDSGEAHFLPSDHLPQRLRELTFDADLIGADLERKLSEICGDQYNEVHTRPLVSGGQLFGSVGMFFAGHCTQERCALAEGLIDLAAIALDNEKKLAELTRSHAELRASQEALARTETLRALGQMAAGVSHDLKNILNPLSLHLQLAARCITQARYDDATRNIKEARQTLSRGVETIERLRDYGRQEREPRTEEVDLGVLAREASKIARPRMSGRGGAVTAIKEEFAPAVVRGRSAEIVSALVNLIVNAIDAMQSGGNITLRSGQDALGSWVQVEDDGPGMSPEVERRVFEPFFSTKGDQGTGLGLSMVFACMQRHGGSVKLTAVEGQGTAFTLHFPRSTSIPPPRPA